MSAKRLLLFGFVLVLLITIPLTVFLVGQQQQTNVGATPSTTFAFVPSTVSKNVGEAISVGVQMNPGQNQISFVKLVVTYDATKLTATSNCIVPNAVVFPSTLQNAVCNNPGTISITLSIGGDVSKIITATNTKIATLNFTATNPTNGTPTQLLFNSSSQALSIGSSDQFNENVLLSSPPANITIGGVAATPTPTPIPSASPVGATGSSGTAPTCTSLSLDRQSTGTAPYPITFTAAGTAGQGTISKATFSFGDGAATDVTTGGGIGTSSVNIPIAHTYNNAGNFTATVVLTDSTNKTSSASTSTCTKSITVTSGTTGGSGTPTTIVTIASPTPTPIITTLPEAGPGDKIIFGGAVGAVISVLGILLFLAL